MFGSAEFTEAAFCDNVEFIGAAFSDFSSFTRSVFAGDANFAKATFSNGAVFRKTEFSGNPNFSLAAFSFFADFREAVFIGFATFQAATFSSGVTFAGASFFGADFRETAFSSDAYFHKAAFSGPADFRKAEFSGDAEFHYVVFGGFALFRKGKFGGSASFNDATFGRSPPEFHDAQSPEALSWDRAQWPKAPKDEGDAYQHILAYAWLKAEMEKRKRHEDEQLFFAKELRARRVLEKPPSPQWLANIAYQMFSGYGRSIALPLAWLVGLFALGAIFFARTPIYKDAPLPPDVAAGLSATNLISLLPFKPDKDIAEHLSPLAKIFGDAQAVLGVVLLFLFGLGLRNRFRMK